MIDLMKKYREIITYGLFGICTTIINIIAYYLSAHILNWGTTISTIIAWFLAVVFALITNKIWVFKSNKWDKKTLIKEVTTFFTCRILTGLLDLGIMILFVDIFHFNDVIMKIISNIIVIIINYIASKLIIFNKNKH